MCGIHGVINVGHTAANLSNYIFDGFLAGQVRGQDSSGIFQISQKGKAFVYKRALAGSDFVHNSHAKRFLADAKSSLLTVCHVRAATQGSVDDDNAHPFVSYRDEDSYVMGVHNGTLTGWTHKPGAREYDVDSEWAYSRIAAQGIDAFKDFAGSWCFVWWDSRHEKKLNIVRNDQRPLHFGISKDKKQLVFGSEAGMVSWLASRNNIDINKEVFSLAADTLYEFDLSGKEIVWSKTPVPTKPVYTHPSNNVSVIGKPTQTPEAAEFCDRLRNALQGKSTTPLASTVKTATAQTAGTTTSSSTNSKDGTTTSPTKDSDTKTVNEPDELWLAQRNWFSSSTATAEEQAAAIEAGVFGEVHWMEAVIRELDNGKISILGELRDYVSGQGHVDYTVYVRDVSEGMANMLMADQPDGRNGGYCVVIGMGEERLLGKYVVMTTMSPAGIKHFNKKLEVKQ